MRLTPISLSHERGVFQSCMAYCSTQVKGTKDLDSRMRYSACQNNFPRPDSVQTRLNTTPVNRNVNLVQVYNWLDY